MEAIILALISGVFSGGFATIVVACLQRRWSKKDKEDGRLDAIVAAQKLTMIDHAKEVAKEHIESGHISLEDKEHFMEMYSAYKALGGNGHLEIIKNEIEHLKITG